MNDEWIKWLAGWWLAVQLVSMTFGLVLIVVMMVVLAIKSQIARMNCEKRIASDWDTFNRGRPRTHDRTSS